MPLLLTTDEGQWYGPYLHARMNRRIVVLKRLDGSSTSMMYARWLLQQRLGRPVGEGVHADHIDEDPLNDEPDNIQPLPAGDNIRKSHAPPEMIEFDCPVCGDRVAKLARKVRANRKQGKAGPFCGKRCAGRGGVVKQGTTAGPNPAASA